MDSHTKKHTYRNSLLVISLLAGAGIVVGYAFSGSRSGQYLAEASSATEYRIDWLGV